MTGVQIDGHDPNAQDTSTADQRTISQIEGEQRSADAWELQQTAAAVVGMFDPSMELAQQAEAAVAMGHGFVFDPEQAASVLLRAQDQLYRLQAYQQMTDTYHEMYPPAPDLAGSVLQVTVLSKSVANLEARIKSQIAFLVDWINKLNRAKQNYMRQEHMTETQWQQLTSGLK